MNGKLEMMKGRLVNLIEKWLVEESESDLPCYIGDNAALFMAMAAMSVLAGMTDMEEYLREGNMIAED